MRREFSRKIRASVALRAGGCCEACGAKLKVGEGEYDHILPDQLGGEPTAENCSLVCRVCHRAKTATDVGRIRKGDRQRDRHTGAMKSRNPMRGSRAHPLQEKRLFNGKVEKRT
jgi:5-methylcytosine-specific restriction protein A